MRSPFTIFATSRFVDREAVVEQLRRAAKKLREERPEVRAVYCFGSFAEGIPTPRSDADILVMVGSSDRPMHQRGAFFMDVFLDLSVPVDLFVSTEDEWENAQGGIVAAARRGFRLA